MPDDIIRELARFRADGVPCVLAVVVKVEGSAPRHPGAKMLIFGGGESLGTIGGGALEAAVMKEAPAVLAQGEPAMLKYDLWPDLGMVCGGRAEVYLEPHLTPPRLFIFGAGHIGLALCPVAAELGFMVTVVDDREGLATPERFPRAAALILSFDPEQTPRWWPTWWSAPSLTSACWDPPLN